MRTYFIVLVFILFFSTITFSQEIILHKKDATVWGTDQVIKGHLDGFSGSTGTLFLNDNPVSFNITDDEFNVRILITEGENHIYAQAEYGESFLRSDTLELTLGYNLKPELYAYASAEGNSITLHSEIVDNPDSSSLSYHWEADHQNPAMISISSENEPTAYASLPVYSPEGEYYFNLSAISSKMDTINVRTYITLTDSGIIPFDILSGHARWINEAVIYQITPYNFVENGGFDEIAYYLDEITELGVNTLYLQPIFTTHYRGQGYDVKDYFGIRADYGTAGELRNLIQTAKQMGMHVIIDFVPNHSSFQHPYAQHSLEFGEYSHYYNYYQREISQSPYSSDEKMYQGFVHYFDWTHLPNWNHDNPEVQRYLFEAARYWVEEFGVDGYRFDAVWAATGRTPGFTKELRLQLKRIKPEILLLAEDKATQDQVFDERFDLAYDWTPEYWWVSHWSWARDVYGSLTIFNNNNQSGRCGALRRALTNNGNGFHPNARVLHFMENNDIYRFVQNHSIEQTKQIAALMFTLDGVPMMYNGQETGYDQHPYSTHEIYYMGYTMKSRDDHGLFPYFKNLIDIRRNYPALTSNNLTEINMNSNTFVFGFRRWLDDQNIFMMLNMSQNHIYAKMIPPLDELDLDSSKTYYLTDLFSGNVISGTAEDLSSVDLEFEGYEYMMLSLADTIAAVVSTDEYSNSELPDEFELSQNYPNPFNASTTIEFMLPLPGHVEIIVYDILGREAAVAFKGFMQPGRHKKMFKMNNLSSGIYFYRMNYNGTSLSHKMVLLK